MGRPRRSAGSLSRTHGAPAASRACRGKCVSATRGTSTTLPLTVGLLLLGMSVLICLQVEIGEDGNDEDDDEDEAEAEADEEEQEEEEEEEAMFAVEIASIASRKGLTILFGSSKTCAKKKLASACRARS